MWTLSSTEKKLMKIVGYLSLPFLYPFVWLAKLSSETGFRTISEFLSLIPFAIGIIVRYEFYKRTLRSCGENVFINFGTVFYYRDISMGSNIDLGMYCGIHHCDFGNNVMVADGCHLLSGSRYHNFDRTDIPMTHQAGKMKRIRIGNDVWIGVNSVIMDDISEGCVVGAGSVIREKVEPFSVVVANPTTIIKKRQVE
jgi:acetyltransferase-like isoleucine patch superfamily enzyme